MKSRYRIGVRVPVLTNAGIFIVNLRARDAAQIMEAVTLIKTLLEASGHQREAARLVFEAASK